jgi:hypothetical protein
VGLRSRLTVAAYAEDLYGAEPDRPAEKAPARGRYTGRRGAIRDATCDDYRRIVETYLLPTLDADPL